MNRHGPWMQTFTGTHFYPADPRPEDINIQDIAHGLSRICRYGGHTKDHYSVAQHSVLVSRIVQARLWGLLHDASEAYVGDVIYPVKQLEHMRGYKVLEHSVQQAICTKYSLDFIEPLEVKRADTIVMLTEMRDIMPHDGLNQSRYVFHGEVLAPLPIRIEPWSAERAETEFLWEFHALTK